jgi:hypothetical protein
VGDQKRREVVAKDLAKLIDEAYEAVGQACKDAESHMHSALMHAIQCGKYLNQAKEAVKSSKLSWDQWRDQFTTVKQTTASLYMRLAESAEISNAIAKNPRLSINKAIELLPKKESRGATQIIEGLTGGGESDGRAVEGASGTDEAVGGDGASGEADSGAAPQPAPPVRKPPNTVAIVKGMVAKFDLPALNEVAQVVSARIDELEKAA